MKRILMLATLALAPGMVAASENTDLNRLWKADVSAVEISGLGMPKAPGKINKIMGGGVAVNGEFPFLVSLQNLAGHFCGGSLIAKNWVLTAEHCVVDGVGAVVIGLHDRRQTAGTEKFQVDRIVPHPLRSRWDYDYALLHLSGDSKFAPIALNRKEITSVVNMVTAGWGHSAVFSIMGERVLQKVTVPFISAERCSTVFPVRITDRMICAGYKYGGMGACEGDSGGPLFMGDGAQRRLVGVVSWSKKGCDSPHVFAKVNAVTEWIDSVIK